MNYTTPTIWLIIACLALGTFGLRFVFIGLVGNREMPPWLLRHLRYTAVAVMPGLIAPLVLWPAATGGQPDPARLSAAAVALVVGVLTKNVIGAIVGGIATLYIVQYLLT